MLFRAPAVPAPPDHSTTLTSCPGFGSPPAYTPLINRSSDPGKPQPFEVTVVSGPGDQDHPLAYAAKDSQAMQRAYRQIREAEGSFRALTATDRAAAKPWVAIC